MPVISDFRRRHRAGAAGDQAVMLDAAVAGEVEDRLLAEHGGVEIAGVDQKLVLFGLGFGDNLAIGIDDQAAADQRKAILDAGLGDRTRPRSNSGRRRPARTGGCGTAASRAPPRFFCELIEGVL